MNSLKFPSGFLLGAATSSYQIEGAWNEDGKGLSIWDTFCHKKGNIVNDENGDVACDHYHRYNEDVALMKEINLECYRLSIAWTRIFPEGRGEVNEKGAQFYDNLIDSLLKAGIKPFITLYHWDLPEALERNGGWLNRETIDDFVNYAKFCFSRYGKKVDLWATFNEMHIVADLGYGNGAFAPGHKNPKSAPQVCHHLNLAHAKTVELFRKMNMNGQIGIVHCLSPIHDMDKTEVTAKNTKIVDGFTNRWFLDPSLKGQYPQDIIDIQTKRGFAPEILDGDMDIIKNNICDFLGINYYFRARVYDKGKDSEPRGLVNCDHVDGAKITEMGWEIYPRGIYELLTRIKKDYGDLPLYVTENGMAAKDDNISGNYVEDDDRLDYLKGHLEMCKKAIDEGVNLKGYMYWSLMDNFEWASGYSKRFGIIRVDYKTLERTIKKSGKWYADF
ncbi:MAG: GH1 family beta-glucosidase, partial [Fibrobacter sp.]|nr:GH1 family beta-glucosidase [Fibrobacter sp.]